MKLFVVGECSPNPDDWSIWSEYSIVIAEDENEAMKLCVGSGYTAVTEIPLTKAVIICKMSEHNWGEDL